MFPLGSVLLPGGVLPLHVFEPRYRQLVADALDDDRTIGMVLIRGADGPVEPAPPDFELGLDQGDEMPAGRGECC